MKCYTYATRNDFGLYRLVHNPHLEVHVLGMGKPWVNFMDKIKGYLQISQESPDGEILLLVDGFDSEILQPEEEILKRFLELDAKVVFGVEHHNLGDKNRVCIIEYAYEYVFDNKDRNVQINSGLCMGYAEHLRIVFERMLMYSQEQECGDDQRSLVALYNHGELPMVTIDMEGVLLYNLSTCCRHLVMEKKVNTCVIQYPGKMSKDRISRGIHEYYPYLSRHVGGLMVDYEQVFKQGAHQLVNVIFDLYEKSFGPQHIREQLLTSVSIFRFSLDDTWKQLHHGLEDVYHVGLLFNNQYILEKHLQSVGVYDKKQRNDNDHSIAFFPIRDARNEIPVKIPDDYPSTTIGEFLERLLEEIGFENFYSYHVKNNNCQHFIQKALKANMLWNDSLQNYFVLNDVDEKIHNCVREWIRTIIS